MKKDQEIADRVARMDPLARCLSDEEALEFCNTMSAYPPASVDAPETFNESLQRAAGGWNALMRLAEKIRCAMPTVIVRGGPGTSPAELETFLRSPFFAEVCHLFDEERKTSTVVLHAIQQHVILA